jgi:hypothetical protein
MIKVFSMLRTLFHNGWSYAKIRSNQGYVGKVRAPARARSRARKLGYARCLLSRGRAGLPLNLSLISDSRWLILPRGHAIKCS